MRAIPVLVLFGLAGGLTSCSVDSDGDKAVPGHAGPVEVAALEARMADWLDAKGSLDWESEEVEEVVGQLLRDYADYANHHHGDSLAAVYGMRRADLLLGKGDAEGAVRQWVDVVEVHPGSTWAAEAMFRVGFTRETALLDTTGALEAYAGIIRSFPESPWAEQARQASTWLTFSEEQMIRSLGANR